MTATDVVARDEAQKLYVPPIPGRLVTDQWLAAEIYAGSTIGGQR